jgi:hypothetical protein
LGFDEYGFSWDGGWYPTPEGPSMNCLFDSGAFIVGGSGLRDGSGSQGNVYLYFPDVPAPGTHTVSVQDGAYDSGELGAGVFDVRDASLWFSDGTGGVAEVVDVGDGAFEVTFTGGVLLQNGGSATGEVAGWLRCVPPGT